jgi:hypothetical protein
MSKIEQKLISKLEPHAKRIEDGNGNDFDYLPAILLRLIEEQKDQAIRSDFIKTSADTVGLQSKEQITKFESAVHTKMEQIDTAIKDAQSKLQNSQSVLSEQIALLVSVHAAHVTHTNESMQTIRLQIESLARNTQRAHANLMRLVIAELVASTAMIGFAVAILQRH